VLWAFVQPTFTIFIFWIVFEVGFRSAPIQNFPFILWLMPGILPWFYLSEAIASSAESVTSNSFLVKKMTFRLGLLPIVKIFSALIIHIFFVVLMFGMYFLNGYLPNLFWLQVIYYLFATIPFLLGLSWITSSVVIFFPDLKQLISLALQFAFWLTPIFWSLNILPVKYHWLFKLNPIYYIVQGYRGALVDDIWFWQTPKLSIYYWSVTFLLFVMGGVIFRKLKPHFGDVI
jgi:lipopolysaccharide transport system permease protein/teichoic acid transport system permease protein